MPDEPVLTVSAIAPNPCPKLTETDGLMISKWVSEQFVNQLVKSAYFCGDDDRGCLNLSSPAGVVELQMFSNNIAQRGRRGAGNVVLGSVATISRIRTLAMECNINVTTTNNPFRQQTVVRSRCY